MAEPAVVAKVTLSTAEEVVAWPLTGGGCCRVGCVVHVSSGCLDIMMLLSSLGHSTKCNPSRLLIGLFRSDATTKSSSCVSLLISIRWCHCCTKATLLGHHRLGCRTLSITSSLVGLFSRVFAAFLLLQHRCLSRHANLRSTGSLCPEHSANSHCCPSRSAKNCPSFRYTSSPKHIATLASRAEDIWLLICSSR